WWDPTSGGTVARESCGRTRLGRRADRGRRSPGRDLSGSCGWPNSIILGGPSYMRRQRRGLKLLALILGLSLLAAACGGDDDDSASGNAAESGGNASSKQAGGTLTDGGTFVGDPPAHLDPALNSELDAYQAVNAIYDGLTDVTDKDETKPMVAE